VTESRLEDDAEQGRKKQIDRETDKGKESRHEEETGMERLKQINWETSDRRRRREETESRHEEEIEQGKTARDIQTLSNSYLTLCL
jgi:hypothetical protein